MSDEDRKALEEDSFEIGELGDEELEDVAGGLADVNESACNGSGCNSCRAV
jgi:hypothetical protein